ncbi:hypothetical protein GCM10029963_53460 [Micromonospora andamanensis]|uniref:hypothetical protein n=1 Tax=Micromonospora andamanensis TaxID=1287068 RepID=UPI00194ECD46|nr:hypothetical protein [Micromonospora andamanensis]GIJ36708.1 hypothetical protein Vwe01_00330 [Micromonospora andamanensis]
MHRPDDQPVVLCLDCDTPCVTPVSRARRVGAGCWRKRRAAARRLAAAVAAATLPAAGQGGPTLLDQLEVTHV